MIVSCPCCASLLICHPASLICFSWQAIIAMPIKFFLFACHFTNLSSFLKIINFQVWQQFVELWMLQKHQDCAFNMDWVFISLYTIFVVHKHAIILKSLFTPSFAPMTMHSYLIWFSSVVAYTPRAEILWRCVVFQAVNCRINFPSGLPSIADCLFSWFLLSD